MMNYAQFRKKAMAQLAECQEERDKWRHAHAEVCAENAHNILDKRELEAELGKGHGVNLLRLAERRATEAERALKDLLTRGEKLMVPRYSAGSDMDQFIAAWNRAKSALDTQAREGE